MRRFVAGCAYVVLASMPSLVVAEPSLKLEAAAHVQEPAEYRALINDALSEYDAHNFIEARALFLQAHGVSPSARTLRGLGMAEFELRNYVDSVRYLEESLASPVKRLEAELRQQAEELLARGRRYVARLALHITPAGLARLQVFLDGASVSLGGDQSLVVPIGEHSLLVQADGYVDVTRRFNVKGAETTPISIAMLKLVASPPPPPPAPKDTHKDERPLRRSPWLWSSVAALVLGGVVTGVVLALQKDKTTLQDDPDFRGTIGGNRVDALIAR